MTPWLEVAIIAFVAQLTVLPGEKVQFIIAGLSTQFHPLLVVSAAGTAFAGWTALEVHLGSALQAAIPGYYLDAATGLLFLGFALALFRSAPSPGSDPAVMGGETDEEIDSERANLTDGGELDVRVPVVGWRVPNLFGGFLPVFALMAVGEFGDKTQLVTIGLAAQYVHGTAIWVGEMAAIIPVSLLNAFVFYRFSHRFDARKAHFAGATLFAFFGVDTLQSLVTDVSVWETVVNTVSTAVTTVL
ncbi:TMEM165/GDT1 family protein [Halosegnis longus]|uniref:TMEM165/GDT1 family protein n=1 Tax=Halosegnis longus TaxID=2216012 RepID=A0AAJ4R9R4_9EURY|nr:TMEM165/GDT1 family protein [Halosegnis longus]RNJ27163.1 TMEM165/GDT1 family protein [Salella cibi]